MREPRASASITSAMGPWHLGSTLLKLTSPRCLGLLEDRLYRKVSLVLALLTVCRLDRPPLGFRPRPPAPQLFTVLPLSPLWTSLCSILKSGRPRPLPWNSGGGKPSSCRLHLLSSFLFLFLLVVLGLHCGTRAFSCYSEEGLLSS